jgi:hypothetical protein
MKGLLNNIVGKNHQYKQIKSRVFIIKLFFHYMFRLIVRRYKLQMKDVSEEYVKEIMSRYLIS